MFSDGADKVVKKLFDSNKNRYPNNLQSTKGNEFVYNNVQLLHYKCHEISLNRGGGYIGSLDWIKNKKVTINPINKKTSKCFQYMDYWEKFNIWIIGKNSVKCHYLKRRFL